MNRFMLCTVVVAALFLSGSAYAALDNYDSYANGTDLLTSPGNGQVSYLTPASGGAPIVGTTTLSAIAEASAQSAPNVMQFADNADNGGSFRARLAPSQALDLSAAGSTARIEFDFKTVSGPGSRISATINALYSVDANAGAEDYIGNPHNTGLSDNGYWWVGNASVLPNPDIRYQGNTWYHWDLQITRPNGAAGGFDYQLELTEIGGGSLGVINFNNAPAAGRDWLTGVGFRTSSNPNETILIDNLSVTPEPASALFVLGGLSAMMLRRRRRV